MKDSLVPHLNDLKAALFKLHHSGPDGFEGLIAVTLHEITGAPFRIAGSGYQRGVDGESSFESDAISFEGKLYKETPARTEVITKIADLARNGVDSDLVWVLGATCRISTQLAKDVTGDGKRSGISVLILDWSGDEIPLFAAALALGAQRVNEFLSQRLTDAAMVQAAAKALSAISLHEGFSPLAMRIRRELEAPAMGIALAREANREWFQGVLSGKARARQEIGQPLSPADATIGTTLPRRILVDSLAPVFNEAPNQKVAFVCGEEGCGKSWLVIQTWLKLEDRPLLLFVPPEEAISANSAAAILDLLITTALRQTGDLEVQDKKQLWRRRFSLWAQTVPSTIPRIVVIIDGVNQRPSLQWGRIISALSNTIFDLGGALICTVRTQYFDAIIRPTLSVRFDCQTAPIWTADERDELLRSKDIDPALLTQSTAHSLRNPRLLGIATELLDAEAIQSIAELSAERLLFEHLMAAGKDQYGEHPVQFVAKLKSHATTLLTRVEQKQTSDLFIFEGDTAAVADGRFFRAVEGEPFKFELRDNGLTLALGYSIIGALRKAKRSGEDIHEALMKLLEPIAALDNTTNVVLAALTVCSADEQEHIPEVTAALVRGFASLQNPEEERFQSFVRLAKARPAAFAAGAASICLAGVHEPNFDWLQAALSEIGETDKGWGEFSQEIRRWLCAFTLDPERGMLPHRTNDPKEKFEQERAERVAKIDLRIRNLSSAEKNLFEKLVKTDGDIDALSNLAFAILAGRNLEPFAEELIAWAFGNALNGSLYTFDKKKFMQLISFNRSDWMRVQQALHENIAALRGEGVSRTGQWTLLRVLYATGAPADAVEADHVYEELTKHQEKFGPWRLLEKYCSVDPCDPASKRPDNIVDTSKKYEEQDTTKLFAESAMHFEDHFFVEARPAIARFDEDIAIHAHREFARDIAQRDGHSLKFGLMEFRKHSALVTVEIAEQFIARWQLLNAVGTQGDTDAAFALQYMLMIVFPILSSDDQINLLLNVKDGDPIFVELMDQLSTPEPSVFEKYWLNALQDTDEYKQYLLLEIANAKNIDISDEICDCIIAHTNSASTRMRRIALALCANGQNQRLLTTLVKSGWTAIGRTDINGFEEWYGSLGLLHAAKQGLIGKDELLQRISPRTYGLAATMLPSDTVRDIILRVDASLRVVVGLKGQLLAPEILLELDGDDTHSIPRFRVDEVKLKPEDAMQALKQLSQSDEEFRHKEKKNHDLFRNFVQEISTANALVILDRTSFEDFEALIAARPHFADQWYEMFMSVGSEKLPAVQNFMLLLAKMLSETSPDKAVALFGRVENSRPLIRFTFGRNALTLETVAAWQGDRSSLIDQMRKQRLDSAVNNHMLSQEVLAALDSKHHSLLEEYVNDKLGKPEPCEIARGITVAGFGDHSDFNDEALARCAGYAGLIGDAQRAAKEEYDRNKWARYWFSMMCAAPTAEAFWKYSILFMRITDGRLQAWRHEYDLSGELLEKFGLSVHSQLRNRFDRIKTRREKKLFGQDVPDICFLR